MADLFEPYERLIRITILGRPFDVPENNIILRQMQFLAPDIASGRYCWNGECRYCEILYCRDETAPEQPALSCRVKGLEGMKITKLAGEMKYNMSEVLSAKKAP